MRLGPGVGGRRRRGGEPDPRGGHAGSGCAGSGRGGGAPLAADLAGAAVRRAAVAARAAAENGVAGSGGFDYDLVIIGAGVGGHGAALHAVEEVSADHVYCSV